jgi:subtilisin family serine protease
VSALAVLVAVAAPATDAVAAAPSAPASVDPSLAGAVAKDGTAKVIVALADSGRSLANGSTGISAAASAQAAATGARLLGDLPGGSHRDSRVLQHLGMFTTTVDAKGLDALVHSSRVASVSADKLEKTALVPEENLIGAPFAWTFGAGFNGTGQSVAIIDTGVQPDHPFFGGRVIAGSCFNTVGSLGPGVTATSNCAGGLTNVTGDATKGAPCTSVPDECLHGTHVAGIAAGGSGGTTGHGSGVAWGANILASNVFTTINGVNACFPDSTCIGAFDSDVIAGLNWAIGLASADHVAAANMSLGSGNSTTFCDASDGGFHAAFASLRAAKIAPTVASGNSYASSSANGFPNGISSPACDSLAVSVGAVTDTNTWVEAPPCDFSGLSPCSFAQDYPNLSLLAPGWSVDSSVPTSTFATLWGTSMATPFVTGAFALIRSQHTDWNIDDITALLRGTGVPIRDTRPGALNEATPSINLASAVDPPTFHAISPTRLLDTRNSAGLPNTGTRLGPGAQLDVRVTGSGTGGVPTNALAVVLNITAVNPDSVGFVTAWPSGMPQPATSNLNTTPGVTQPNLTTVKVGADGKVTLFNNTGNVDLVVDVSGYYDTGGAGASGGTFHPTNPTRLLDTRDGTGLPGNTPAKLGPNGTIDLHVAAGAGLPAGATAVVLNVQSVNPTQATFITAYPDGTTAPTASNLNPEAGQVDDNLVVVKLGAGAGADGDVELFNHTGSLDLVADMAGWFDNTATPTTGHAVPLAPARLLDTRSGIGVPVGQLHTNTTIQLQVTGRGGVPVSGVSAVVLNLTAVTPSANTFVTAWPDGSVRPTASSLNPIASRITPNLVTVKVGPNGKIDLYNLVGNLDLVADVFAWYSG